MGTRMAWGVGLTVVAAFALVVPIGDGCAAPVRWWLRDLILWLNAESRDAENFFAAGCRSQVLWRFELAVIPLVPGLLLAGSAMGAARQRRADRPPPPPPPPPDDGGPPRPPPPVR